jgi:hypothetical protein
MAQFFHRSGNFAAISVARKRVGGGVLALALKYQDRVQVK